MNFIVNYCSLFAFLLLSVAGFSQPVIVKTDPLAKSLLKSTNEWSDPFSEPWMRFQTVTDSFLVVDNPDQLLALATNQIIGSNREITFRLDGMTWNDSLFTDQWNLRMVGFTSFEFSDFPVAPVTVAIIDTGIEPDHPDLVNQLWENSDDPVDGTDNDGDGLTDDYHGFDFTGRQPDFQPTDDQGHGTSVAGIIAAEGNNAKGIVGLASHSRILSVKAFDETGNGTELNIAKALLYAWYRKADVVNMSFGINNEKSLLIESLVRAMADDGIIFVASSGNRGGFDRHYPSAYEGVISVGAATEFGSRAFFSQFGNRLDVLAPGTNIITTERGKSWGLFSGTSAAAPHVSALAAWMKAINPKLKPEEFRVHLQVTANKTDPDGFSAPDGAGVVNFYNAIRLNGSSGMVRIQQPESDSWLTDQPQPVKITAATPNFESWQLFLQTDPGYPDDWTLLASGSEQIIDSVVTFLNPALFTSSDTLWSLRLRVSNKTGSAVEDRRFLFRKKEENRILDTLFYRGYDGLHPIVGMEMRTAHPSTVVLSDGIHSASNQSWRHLTVSQFPVPDETDRQVTVVVSDLTGDTIRFQEQFPASKPIHFQSFHPDSHRVQTLPAGYILAETPDFDGDGDPDLVLSLESESSEFGPIYFYSGLNATEPSDSITGQVLVPKDVVRWNDRWYFLAISLGRTFIYQNTDNGHFPAELLFESSASSEMWAACLDTTGGILTVIWRDSKGYYRSQVNPDAGSVNLIQTFDFPVNYSISGPPRVIPVQFSEKGETDYFLSDQNGNLLVFRQTGESVIPLIFADPLPLYLSSDYIAASDITGDGREELVILSRDLTISDPVYDEFWPGRWNFRIYTAHSGQPEILEDRWFTGYQPSAKDRSSLHIAGNTVIISVDPHLYFINYTGTYPLNYESAALFTGSPASSAGSFNAQRLWSNSNGFLTVWDRQPEILPVISSFIQTSDTSGTLVLDKQYPEIHYTISQNGLTVRDSLYNVSSIVLEGKNQATIQVFSKSENRRVRVGINTTTVRFFPQGRIESSYKNGWIRLEATNPILESFALTDSIWIWNGSLPTQWMPGGAPNEYWIKYSASLTGLWMVPHLMDQNGRKMIPENEFLEIPTGTDTAKPFHISSFSVETRTLASVQFNQSINASSLEKVQAAQPFVTLKLKDPLTVTVNAIGRPFGNIGNSLVLDFGNIQSVDGDSLDSRTRYVDLSVLSETVADLIVYPNPWNQSHIGFITFGGIPGESSILIFNTTLRKVAELTSEPGTNSVNWNGKDDSGRLLGSGIYIYQITGPDGKTKTGKLAIVR